MAFSTIQGSGSAPDSFVGTSGVDTIALVNETGNFFLGAQQSGDVVNFVSSFIDPGVISGVTLKGGQGSDTFVSNTVGMVYAGMFLNANSDADTITFGTAGTISGSTIQGGQGVDVITASNLSATIVNGNRDDDTITIGGANSNSSVFGGQGNDTITVTATTSSVVGGDDGNDSVTVAAGSVAGSTINGGAGNDTITAAASTSSALIDGGDGNDSVTGSGNNDTLTGGAGNDTLTGGLGADIMSGGAGSNQFAYGAAVGLQTGVTTTTVDVIADFRTAVDSIQVGAANTFAVAGASYATLADAVAGEAMGSDFEVVAVGTVASGFTSYLLEDQGATGGVTGAIQLGAIGAFATVGAATATIVAGDIVA